MRRRFIKTQTSLSYMTIEAIEYTTVELPAKIEYSLNGINTWEEGHVNDILHLQPGATVSFRNMGDRELKTKSFNIRGSCNLLGNCMSLIPDKKMFDYAFAELFEGCSGIISVSEDFLPATTLANDCYRAMFQNCTSLVTAPELPATTLAHRCYYGMFQNCTSLVTAPELPATTLAKWYCYESMFEGCTKLNYIKALFTTTPSTSYTDNWVDGVSSTGTFIKNKNATWNVIGANGIPTGWTVQTA